MISFIVIGKNEGWRLSFCFKAIKELIAFNMLKNSEIIYVDSNSNDNSIEIAKENNVDEILKISGNINAAIARNTGSHFAKGELLFFLDGDTEIQLFHIQILFNNEDKMKFSYVVGFLDDINYDENWIFISKTQRHEKRANCDIIVSTVGGAILIIPKQIWNAYKGMDERLKRTQDRDFSLRMSKHNIIGVRKNEILGLHHTIPYNNSIRIWKMLFSGSTLYKSITIRKHLTNKHLYKFIYKEEWSVVLLVLAGLLSITNPLYLLFYLLGVIYKARKGKLRIDQYFLRMVIRIINDVLLIVGIFFFYPKKPRYKVEIVTSK